MLVLHPGALGDVLLAVPALRALRAAHPRDEITLAAQPRLGRLLAALGVVDRGLPFDALGLEALFADVEPRPRLRELAAGERVVSWFGAGDERFASRLAALAPGAVVAAPHAPGADTWRHLLASVATLTGDVGESREPLSLPAALVAKGRALLAAAGWRSARRLVMLHAGAGSPAKCWAPEAFAALARRLAEAADVEIVLHEGPADHPAVAALRARLGGEPPTLVQAELEALAGALRHVALWVGNDSGVSHLAAAIGAPALVLFAERNLAWRPWARAARTLTVAMGAVADVEVDAVVREALAVLGAGTSVDAGAVG